MPIMSKYSNQKIEKILNEVLDVLRKNEVSLDLALMILGNSTTHIINNDVPAEKRTEIADKFTKAFNASIKTKEK